MEISLRQVAYFLRLVEKGSFTAAASSLGITQPALSIAIAQLEKTLAARLVERGNPIKLTDSGITFHRYALRIDRDVREARDEVSALNSGLLGRLDLCIGPSAAGPELSAVLAGMVAEFPELEIHVLPGVLPAVADRLHNNEFSAYVGTIADDFADPTLTVVELTTLTLAVVCGASHPLARRRRVAPAELLQYPWIAIGNVDANLPSWRDAFHAAGLEAPRPAIDVRTISLVYSLLGQGRFLTILPLSIVGDAIAAGLLATVKAPGFEWRLRLDAVSRADVALPAAGRIFLDRLVQQFQNKSN